jgi:hypothetical protein
MTDKEKAVARRLINALLDEPCLISVACDGEVDVEESTNRAEIFEYATACYSIEIIGHGVGWFSLIYGNAPDGSELISNHSDNEICNRIYKAVYA